MFREPHWQLLDPDTMLFIWKGHHAHLRGRNGHPGKRGYDAACRLAEHLEQANKEQAKSGQADGQVMPLFLAGLWYDCKNPNLELYLVTEPAAGEPYPDTDSHPNYYSVLQRAQYAAKLLAGMEDGQSVSGNVAEYWYTGGADYEHSINKFYGRFGLLRGLAEFDGAVGEPRLAEFRTTRLWQSHPEQVQVYSFDDFEKELKKPPRGRYGVADLLQWKIIAPKDLELLIRRLS